MWELDHKEGWAPRTDASELWCWRRLLRVPWTARRSNQSILKEINPKYSFGGLILMLNLQYFSHLMVELTHWKRLWFWERLKAKGEGGRSRRWDGDGTTVSMEMNLSKPQETIKDRKAWPAAVHGATKGQIWLSNWATMNFKYTEIF